MLANEPLVVPRNDDQLCRIVSALDEPLFPIPGTRAPERCPPLADIFSALTVLDTLIVPRSQNSAVVADLLRECDAMCLEHATYRRIVLRQDASPSAQFIELFGWQDWLSHVAASFGIETSASWLSRDEYQTRIAQLNVAFSLAQQLRLDLSLSNCRYIAHQMALLYAALQQLGGSFKEFQTTIQSRFAEMKQTAGKTDTDETRFNQEQIQWLYSLCSDIMNRILFVESLKQPVTLP